MIGFDLRVLMSSALIASFLPVHNASIATTVPRRSEVAPTVVQVEPCGLSSARATGFLIGPRLVLTVAHITQARSKDATDEWLLVSRGLEQVLAELVASDPARDIALLRLPSNSPSTATRLAWRTPQVGDRVASLVVDAHNKVVRRSLVVHKLVLALGPQVGDVTPVRRAALALDGSILPGDSGAPLLDSAGNVVGMLFSESRGRVGGYAIDATELQSFVRTAASQNVTPPTVQSTICDARKPAVRVTY